MDTNPQTQGILGSPIITKLGAIFLIVAIVFIGAKTLNAIVNFDTISEPASNTISVQGEGKISAAPDIALISFTVSENGDNSADAQDAVAKKIKVALEGLKGLKIADKDIKTGSYSVYPRYANQQPCYAGQPCVYGEQKIVGFTASQTVEVKVRAIDETGKVLSALGDAGISNLNGPNFTLDDPDAVRAEARKEAIKEARAKAKQLASDLGVRIVRVVNYSENGAYPPMPYFKNDMMAAGSAAPREEIALPAGENDIIVNVSVVYEIR